VAQFIKSCTQLSQYPHSDKEILMVGRSNVGKSTFINLFCAQKIAFVGKTPGKTRLLNFYQDEGFTIVDAPGYGYARRSVKELEQYGLMMEEYFQKRECLKAVLLLLDARRIPNRDDLDMLHYLQDSHLKTYVIVTKLDKLKQSQLKQALNNISNTLDINKEQLILSSPKKSRDIREFRSSLLSTI